MIGASYSSLTGYESLLFFTTFSEEEVIRSLVGSDVLLVVQTLISGKGSLVSTNIIQGILTPTLEYGVFY